MIVKCIATELTKENLQSFGKDFCWGKTYDNFVIGEQYLVFAMDVSFGSCGYGTGVYVHLIDDAEYLLSVPLMLFEIVDSTIPKDWVYHPGKDRNFALWPTTFLKHKYFHQDLADQVPEVVKDFEELRNKYEREFLSQE